MCVCACVITFEGIKDTSVGGCESKPFVPNKAVEMESAQEQTNYSEGMDTSVVTDDYGSSPTLNTRRYYGFDEIITSPLASGVWVYGAPPVFVLGTIGNILSAVVMNRKSLRASTTSFYLTVLAVADTALLYFGFVPLWIQQQYRIVLGRTPGTACTTHWSLIYFCAHFEPAVLVSVAVERFVAVWFPIKHKVIFTKPKAAIGLLVLMIIFIAETAHVHFTLDTYDCHNVEKHLRFYYFVYPWIDMALSSFIPFVIMITLSVAIVWKLIRSQKLENTKSAL